MCLCVQSAKEVSRTEPGGVVMAGGEGGGTGASASVGRVDTTAGGPSASQRPSSPPPSLDMFCPIAENWCYTQVGYFFDPDLLTISVDGGAERGNSP